VLNIKFLHRKQAVINRFSTAFIAAFSALARYRRRHEGKVISYLTAESNQQRLLQGNSKNAKRIASSDHPCEVGLAHTASGPIHGLWQEKPKAVALQPPWW